VLVLGSFLSIGLIAGNLIGYIAVLLFFILLITNRTDALLLFIISLIYIGRFYVGQGWVTNIIVEKYLLKGHIYVVIPFVIFAKNYWFKKYIERRYIKWAITFLLIVLILDLLHFSFNANIINMITFILLFFLILNMPKSNKFDTYLINLLIAVGVLQVIISYLQVNQFISPPRLEMTIDGSESFLWVAGLDDAASGTFGAVQSNVTTWFSIILFLFFFSVGFTARNRSIIILSFIFPLQVASVDSKTVTIIGILSFIYLLKRLRVYNILRVKNILYVFLIFSFSLVFTKLVTIYYKNLTKGISEPAFYIEKTIDLIYYNFWDWGKFAGFINITRDHLDHNPVNIFIGYGRDKYDANRIIALDKPLMKANKITRSSSAFIKIYGELGLVGLFLIIYLYILLKNGLKKIRYRTNIGLAFQKSGLSILLGSFLIMFLYIGHNFGDQAFFTFFILHALVLRKERDFIKSRTQILQNKRIKQSQDFNNKNIYCTNSV
jgi:hypothetical protein